jgi:hypothetical protein
MIANLGCKWLRAWMSLALLMCALPAAAQTRAWLDREQVTYGETATLNIETGSSVQQIDYAPLTRQFDIAGQTVRRSFQLVNGHSSSRSLFAVGIRARRTHGTCIACRQRHHGTVADDGEPPNRASGEQQCGCLR